MFRVNQQLRQMQHLPVRNQNALDQGCSIRRPQSTSSGVTDRGTVLQTDPWQTKCKNRAATSLIFQLLYFWCFQQVVFYVFRSISGKWR